MTASTGRSAPPGRPDSGEALVICVGVADPLGVDVGALELLVLEGDALEVAGSLDPPQAASRAATPTAAMTPVTERWVRGDMSLRYVVRA